MPIYLYYSCPKCQKEYVKPLSDQLDSPFLAGCSECEETFAVSFTINADVKTAVLNFR